MLVATLDWEVEYLSETGYKRDLLLGKSGLPTDIYTPVGTTDPNRHPVVLWAGPVGENDSISLITESALATRDMIENVEFIVGANDHDSERLRTEIGVIHEAGPAARSYSSRKNSSRRFTSDGGTSRSSL